MTENAARRCDLLALCDSTFAVSGFISCFGLRHWRYLNTTICMPFSSDSTGTDQDIKRFHFTIKTPKQHKDHSFVAFFLHWMDRPDYSEYIICPKGSSAGGDISRRGTMIPYAL
eukprot:scaffold337642_cov21-Prasinocladus_malaysianus.AAC.1